MLLLPWSTNISCCCMHPCDLNGITCSNDTRFWCVCCTPMETSYLHPLPKWNLLGFKSNCRYCGAFQVVLVEKNCQCRRHKRHGFDPWVRKIPWSRKWQPIPIFLPGKFHGKRNLAGYSQWGCKESDTTEQPDTIPYNLILTWSCLQRPYFKIWSHAEVPGVRL